MEADGKEYIRIVRQRRKTGGPFFVQLGKRQFTRLSRRLIWVTSFEFGDYRSREEAIAAVRKMPDTWGDKRRVLNNPPEAQPEQY